MRDSAFNRIAEPLRSLTLLPSSLSFSLIFEAIVDTNSMGLVILKSSLISVTIRLPENTLAVHQAILKFTVIILKIRPLEETFSVHIVVLELAFINLSIVGEVILSLTVHLSFLEVSSVDTSIVRKLALAILFSVDELALVDFGGFLPHLFALSMLLVINPGSLINGAFIIDESSISVGLTVNPRSLVDITIGVGHSSLTVRLAVFDLSLVEGSIFIVDFTDSLLAASLRIPVSTISDAITDILSCIVPLKIGSLIFHKVSELLARQQWALISDVINQFLVDLSELLDIRKF